MEVKKSAPTASSAGGKKDEITAWLEQSLWPFGRRDKLITATSSE